MLKEEENLENEGEKEEGIFKEEQQKVNENVLYYKCDSLSLSLSLNIMILCTVDFLYNYVSI